MGVDFLAVALVWSVVLAVLLADHVQRREAWFETAPEQNEPTSQRGAER